MPQEPTRRADPAMVCWQWQKNRRQTAKVPEVTSRRQTAKVPGVTGMARGGQAGTKVPWKSRSSGDMTDDNEEVMSQCDRACAADANEETVEAGENPK